MATIAHAMASLGIVADFILLTHCTPTLPLLLTLASRTGGSVQLLRTFNAQLPGLIKAALGRREGVVGVLDMYCS